jgi:hypothetical protein
LGIADQFCWYNIPKNRPCQGRDAIFWYNIPKIDIETVAALAVFRYSTRRRQRDEAIMAVFAVGELSSGR